jgi:hypothetical protein
MDVFYVTNSGGAKLSEVEIGELKERLTATLSATAQNAAHKTLEVVSG